MISKVSKSIEVLPANYLTLTQKPLMNTLKSDLVITERDYQIFKAIWKWKCLSTPAISAKFFAGRSEQTTYHRLWRLEHAGYLKFSQIDRPGHGVWLLTSRSFKDIRAKMVELQSEGFKSENIEHDWRASALHLGDWLCGQPEGSQTFSEQQLRRIPMDLWPAWVPQSELHRADGYSLVKRQEGSLVVAFEAELSIKAKNRYEQPATFYESQQAVSCVVWLVNSSNSQGRLLRALEKHGARDLKKHHFIYLPEFQQHGWNAHLRHGYFGGSTLRQMVSTEGPTRAQLKPNQGWALKLLDIQKKPILSKRSAVRVLPAKAN